MECISYPSQCHPYRWLRTKCQGQRSDFLQKVVNHKIQVGEIWATYKDFSIPGISQKWILSNAHLYLYTYVFDLVLARSMFHVFFGSSETCHCQRQWVTSPKNPATWFPRCFDGRFMKCLDFPMGNRCFWLGVQGTDMVSHLKNQRIVFPCKNHYKSTSILRCDKGRKQTWTYCWWKKSYTSWYIWQTSHYLQGFIHVTQFFCYTKT